MYTGISLNKIGLICIGILSLFACSSKGKVPKEILSLNNMKVILWDVSQADAYASQYLSRDTTIKDQKKESLIVYQKVFLLHKITKEKFIKSIQYYQSHPEVNQILLDSTMQYSNRMKNNIQNRRMKIAPVKIF